MTVYTWRLMDTLYDAVRMTASRLLNEFNVQITGDEFIKTYIKSEHIEPLRTTQKIVGQVGDTYFTTVFPLSDGKTVSLSVGFANNKPPIILPNYVRQGMSESAPDDVISRITAYADERVRLGRMFGDAIDALRYLNEACGNANAMAVMFPAMPALFKMVATGDDDANAKRGRKISEAKSFGKLPKLPRPVTNRILECSNLVLNTMMLEALPPSDAKQPKHQATLKVHNMATPYKDFIYDAIGQIKDATFV